MKCSYLLFVSIVLMSSCRENSTTVLEYKKVKTVLIESSSNYQPLGQQIAIIDGKETLILSCDDYKLRFYDLEKTELINEISLDVAGLDAFEYLNKDSILILYGNRYTEHSYIDTNYFVLMNYAGEVVKGFPINNPLVWSLENQPLSVDDAIYPALSTNDLRIFDNKVFFFLNKMNPQNIGSSGFIKNASPIISVFDLLTDSLTVSNSLWYPGIKEGIYYPSDFATMYHALSHNNLPLIRFYYSSMIYEWNFRNDDIHEFSMKTQYCDSIMPLNNETTFSDNNIEGMYLQLQYDPFRELYFSIFMFSPDIYGMGVWSQLIYDKNFQLVSEIFQPQMQSFNPLFTKKHIISVSRNMEGKISVNYWNLVQSGKNKEEYNKNVKRKIKSIKEKRKLIINQHSYTNGEGGDKINKFLHSKFEINSKDYAFISVNVDVGCLGCRRSVLSFISENVDFFQDKPFYLLLSGYTNYAIERQLNEFNLNTLNKTYCDTLNIIKSLDDNDSRSPRLVIYKNNVKVLDSIFDPNNIERGLIPKLVNSLGGEVTFQ